MAKRLNTRGNISKADIIRRLNAATIYKPYGNSYIELEMLENSRKLSNIDQEIKRRKLEKEAAELESRKATATEEPVETTQAIDDNTVQNTTDDVQETPVEVSDTTDMMNYANDVAKQQASLKYDQQLEDLNNQKNQLKKDLYTIRNQSIDYASFTGLDTNNRIIRLIQDSINEIDNNIIKLLEERKQEIASVVDSANPKKIAGSTFYNYAMLSDVYKLANAEKQRALTEYQKQPKSIFETNEPLEQMKIKRTAAAQNLVQAEERLADITQMIDEAQKFIELSGQLPNSIEEFPKDLQAIAKEIFHGGQDLQNQEFRDTFKELQSVNKIDVDRNANIAFNTERDVSSTEEINQLKDEYKALRDAYGEIIPTDEFVSKADALRGMNAERFGGVNPIADRIDRKTNNSYSNLSDAIKLLDKATKHKDINDDVKDTDDDPWYQGIYNIGRAVYETYVDPNTWNNNTTDLSIYSKLNKVADKKEKEEKLTASEKALETSAGLEKLFHDEYGAYENADGYKAGQTFAESLKFMAEFIVTGGVLSGGQAIAKKGAEKIATKMLAKYGKSKLTSMISKAADIGLRLTADASYAALLENTVLLPRVISDAEKLKLGNINAYRDEFGNVKVAGYENRYSDADAYRLSETRNFIENFSEMMGEWGIGRGLYSGTKYVPGLKQLTDMLNKGVAKTTLKLAKKGIGRDVRLLKLAKAGQYHGFLGEMSEEYYGIALNHLFGSNDATYEDGTKKSFLDDITDPQQFWDIAAGIALSTGFLGAIQTGNYMRAEHNYNKAKLKLSSVFTPTTAEKIEKAFAWADDNESAKIFNVLNNGTKTELEKRALFEYYDAFHSYRGASIAEDRLKRRYQFRHDLEAKRAQEAGYMAADYNNRRELNKAIDIMRDRIAEQLGIKPEEVNKYIRQRGGVSAFVQSKINSGEWTREEANPVLAYDNARNVRNGMTKRIYDMQNDEAVRAYNRSMRLSNEDGEIAQYSTKNGPVYVVRGNVVLKPGSQHDIDYELSDNDIMVRDARGNLMSISTTELTAYNFSVDAKQQAEYAYNAMMRMLFEQNKKLDDYQVKAGYKFNIGQGKTLTIVGSSISGGMVYAVSDQNADDVQVLHADSVNGMRNIINDYLDGRARDITRFYDQQAIKEELGLLPKEAEVEEEAPAQQEDTIVQEPTARDKRKQKNIERANVKSEYKKQRDELKKQGLVGRKAKKRKRATGTEELVVEQEPVQIPVQPEQATPISVEQPKPAVEQPEITTEQPEAAVEQTKSESRPVIPEMPKDQQDAIDKLNDKIKKDDSSLNRSVTGRHYFMTVDGKRQMFRRVHTEIGDRYLEREDDAALHSELKQKLSDTYSKRGVEGVTDIINEAIIANAQSNRIKDVEQIRDYVDYLNERPEEADEVFEGISAVLSRTNPNYSVVLGQVYDELSRMFFDNVNINTNTEITIDGQQKKLSEFFSADLLNDALNQLQALKAEYDKLGWVISTNRTMLYGTTIDAKTGKEIRIAGEIDAIGIDQNGNYHLIDFKTYNYGYKKYHPVQITSTRGVVTTIDDYITLREEEDSLQDVLDNGRLSTRKPLMSQADFYAKQLTMYSILGSEQLGNIATIETVLIGITKDKSGRTITGTNLIVGEDKHTNRRYLQFDRGLINQYTQYTSEEDAKADKELHEIAKTLKAIADELSTELSNEELNELPASVIEGLNAFVEQIHSFTNDVDDGSFVQTEDKINAISNAAGLLSGYNYYLELIHDELTIANSRKLFEQKQEQLKEEQKQFTEDDYYDSLFSDQTLAINELLNDFRLTYEQLKQYIVDNFATQDGYDVSRITNEQALELTELLTRLTALTETSLYLTGLELPRDLVNQYLKTRRWCVNNIFTPKQINLATEEDHYLQKWYGLTTTYKTNKAVRDGGISFGIEDSTDGKGHKLLDVTGEPDFIENAIFEFVLVNGASNKKYTCVLITYNGITYSPVSINFAQERDANGNVVSDSEITKRGARFLDRVRAELAHKQEGQMVVPAVLPARTNGRIINGKQGSLMSKGFVSTTRGGKGLYIYDIEYTADLNTFCMTTASEVNGIRRVVAQSPNAEGLRGRNTIYVYSGNNPNTNPSIGTVVMMVPRNYTEIPVGKPQPIVPINLVSKTLSEGDVNLIIDILTGKYANGAKGTDILFKNFVENGVNYGVNNIDVLNMLISYDRTGQKGKKQHMHVVFDKRNSNIVHLIGNFPDTPVRTNDKGEVLVTNKAYDLTSTRDLANLKQDLSKLRINISEDFMSLRLANAKHDSLPYKLVQAINEKTVSIDKPIQFGNSSLRFELSDFKENDSDVKGLSGLGWYIKHEILQTTCEGFNNTLIKFDDTLDNPVKTVNKSDLKSQPAPVQNNEHLIATEDLENNLEQAQIVAIDEQDVVEIDDYEPSFDKQMSKKQALGGIVKSEAEKHLDELLGDWPLKWKEDFLALLGSDAVSVGRCYSYFIELSKFATPGTEYHEAFHTILELFVSDKVREKIYRKYRNAHKDAKDLSDREISERLADEFMNFMMNKPTIKLSVFHLTDTFDSIKKWISFYKKIGSFGLYRFYVQSKQGKFRNIKPSKEAIERFKKFAGTEQALNFTVRNVNFKNILNEHEYKVMLNSLVFALLEKGTQSVDMSGVNVQSIRTDVDVLLQSQYVYFMLTSTKLNLDNRTKQAIIEMLGIATDENGIAKYTTEKVKNDNGKEVVKFKSFVKANDNWENVLPDILSKMSQFVSDYKVKFDKIETEEKQGSSTPTLANIDQQQKTSEEEHANAGNEAAEDHVKKSAEFEPISRASQRVKFFFSCVPKKRFMLVNGQRKLVPIANELGLYEFYDHKEVYATVLSELHHVKGIHQLRAELKRLSTQSEMFAEVYNRFEKRWNNALAIDEKTGKEVIKNENELSLLVQIVNSLSNYENEYLVARQQEIEGARTVNIKSTDMEYNARKYKRDWNDLFKSGKTFYIALNKDGKHELKNAKYPKTLLDIASKIGNLYNPQYGYDHYGMSYAFSEQGIRDPKYTINIPQTQVIDGKQVTTYQRVVADINNPVHLLTIKENLVKALNMFGIQIDVNVLEYTLRTKYGDTGTQGMIKFSRDNDQLNKFAQKISSLVYYNERTKAYEINQNINYATFWNDCDLIDTLAKGKYNYRRSTTQLSVLTVGDNKYYVISENNLLTSQLERIFTDKVFLNQMANDPFNAQKVEATIGNTVIKGSRVLKYASEGDKTSLRYVTLSGMKTDSSAEGVKYHDHSAIEDFIAKQALLAKGILINGTMSDKTTFGGIEGLDPFGINYEMISAKDIPTLQIPQNGNIPHLNFPKEVIDQFIEYAMCELRSIEEELNTQVDSKDKVDNYHGGQKVHTIEKDGKVMFVSSSEYEKMSDEEKKNVKDVKVRQGARFSSLLGVHYIVDGKLLYMQFNKLIDNRKGHEGEYMDERANLEYAKKMFFDMPYETQKWLIEQELTIAAFNDIRFAQSLGLISEDTTQTDYGNRFSDTGLDTVKIRNIARVMFGLQSNVIPTEQQMNRATVSYMADLTAKHIMSILENERIYSGNLAYFKWRYDMETGELIDNTTDMFKRHGGLISTGQNNCTDFPGMPIEYTCAECDNEEIVSPFIDEFDKLAYQGEIKTELIRTRLKDAKVSFEDPTVAKEIYDSVDKMSIEDVEKELGNATITIIRNKVAAKTKKFRKVDVNDGAAYITDEMCENLLRMLGIWDDSIKRAFSILRGLEKKKDGTYYTTKDVREVAEAYNKVYTSVIGAQKYTAYGYRPTLFDGVTRMLPYYNKMALFPIFKAMATGPMQKLYEKMTDPNNKVDMLMVKSAVKLGGKGSVPLNATVFESWKDEETFKNFKFNTYTELFVNLRKQFNTDPKEEEMMTVGTQMTKVAMSVLVPGATYNVDGKEITSTKMRDIIMDSIKALSTNGFNELQKRFFDEKGELNVQKFSGELTRQLLQRDANRNVLDAVSVVENTYIDATGKKKKKYELKLPLAAQSSSNWIQSVIASIVNGEVVDVVTPGKAFYQRSVWGLEGVDALSEDDVTLQINDGKKLQMVNEEGSMDCVLSIDFFEDLWKDLPNLRNQSFEAKRNWLIRNGIISGTIHDKNAKDNGVHYEATANIVGYRIPTQAVSSIHALRCVDVIPVVRDTVILPAEFTAITGSDKQYQCSNQYNIKNLSNCWKLLNQSRQSAAKHVYIHERSTTIESIAIIGEEVSRVHAKHVETGGTRKSEDIV